ncbi:MAG: gamma carbonic anhydrase family protein [Oscillospiraceae bacterium]|nr:gamma carbonic anhydrase family protein [Oscillospiraceae bacterium]
MQKSFHGQSPTIASSARLAENAVLVGHVTLEEDTNLWYGAVLRGDESPIVVQRGSNIQDNAVVHVDDGCPVHIGQDVTIGHGAVVHGCTIEDRCIIGMGAILLNGCVIGADSIVAAGALVTQNKVIPPGSLVIGSPAKVARPLTEAERASLLESAENYRSLAAGQLPLFSEG